MPYLRFEINKKVEDTVKQDFISCVSKKFSEIMQTGTKHIAISLVESSKDSLYLGRAKEKDYVCLMNLDIRVGRSNDQINKLVKTYMSAVNKILGIKLECQYITITKHVGEEFHLIEGSLMDWTRNDSPLDD